MPIKVRWLERYYAQLFSLFARGNLLFAKRWLLMPQGVSAS
jgi:hypothetical protein